MEYNGYNIIKCCFEKPSELRALVNLQNTVYSGKHAFNEDSFRFWYLENPIGKVISFNAWDGEEMVAHYACVPVEMKINERVVCGLLDMATVTHPSHRGKGLFKTLAKITYDYASKNGYEYVIGVANDNSYPGYIKYFPFTDVGPLDVKIGLGREIKPESNKVFMGYWNELSIAWRGNYQRYSYWKDCLYSSLSKGHFKNFPFVKIYMGFIGENLLEGSKVIRKRRPLCKPFTLYIGFGANMKRKLYVKAPRFLHPSEFHLIFLDLTGGKLPIMTKDNVFYQLIDFDVV